MINDMSLEKLEDYKKVNSELLKYGWMIGSLITGGDFEKIKRMCEKSSEKSQLSKEDISEINILMVGIVFNPNYRAHYMERAQKTAHIKEFSHHIERAILHYYKEDYFSTIHTLLPAIEGVLLSYYGYEFGKEKKPSQKEFLKKFKEGRTAVFSPRTTALYRTQLIEFLEKWIFQHTNNADFSYSYLNRHYALHGMGNNCYYTFSDCNRLFVVFDMFIEIVSAENLDYKFLIESSTINSGRRKYYSQLIENKYQVITNKAMEAALMKENKNYIDEPFERMQKLIDGDITILKEEMHKIIFEEIKDK